MKKVINILVVHVRFNKKLNINFFDKFIMLRKEINKKIIP